MENKSQRPNQRLFKVLLQAYDGFVLGNGKRGGKIPPGPERDTLGIDRGDDCGGGVQKLGKVGEERLHPPCSPYRDLYTTYGM